MYILLVVQFARRVRELAPSTLKAKDAALAPDVRLYHYKYRVGVRLVAAPLCQEALLVRAAVRVAAASCSAYCHAPEHYCTQEVDTRRRAFTRHALGRSFTLFHWCGGSRGG